MSAHVEIASKAPHPPTKEIEKWVDAAIEQRHPQAEVCIRVIDEDEMTKLNGNYRQKYKPTNVLSFPAQIPSEIELNLLGDIAICAPVVETEAIEQSKEPIAHWAHIVVHGCLHLQGFDHEEEADATLMEKTEIQILKMLGYKNPYKATDDKQRNITPAN